MAASTSCQPNHIPLPQSLSKPPISGKRSTTRKGKGKENISAEVAQQGSVSSDITWDNLESDSAWEWTPLTDPSASRVPPIFTKDGSYFFSLVGSSVKIHSVITGQVVSTLSAPRSTDSGASSDTLTTAILNPHNAFQLITGSLDGRLVVWDFLDAALLQIIDIAQPILYICAHNSLKDVVFVGASRPAKKQKSSGTDDNAVVLRVSLKPSGTTTKSADILPIGKTRFPTGLTFSPSGAWLVATAGHKVYVAMTSSLTSGFTKYVSPERLTCLAFHPTEEYFATGDEKGNIRLWYCLNDTLPINARGVEKKTQTTSLHWHAHAVSSIAFTTNGAYLLSGGEESVLVIWQLHTGKKEFVPRVGAPINAVSVFKGSGSSEEEYLLGLADATYLFVSAGNLKISRGYSRIKLDPAIPTDSSSTSRQKSTLAVHTLTSTLILPSSHPSSLQIYSPSSSKLIAELEVSPSNRVSRRDEKPIEPSYVEQTVLSLSGEWLASVDVRDGDDGFRDEIYLKIWRWEKETSRWKLNTRIDRPHGLRRISSMTFSPSTDYLRPIQLVTTGEDGNVKTWGLRVVKNKAEATEEFWVARSSFGFRSQPPRSASWSPDGSLLAVTFGLCVAIYDASANTLRQTLTSPECQSNSSAHFVGRGGRYLVVVGSHDLVLWDLVAQSIRWSYKSLSILDRVIPDTQENYFTAFHGHSPNQKGQKTRVSIFRAESSSPSSTHSVPFRLRNVCPYPFTQASNQTYVGITQDWAVVLLGESAKLAKAEGSVATEIIGGPNRVKRTLFQDIFGKAAFSETPAAVASIDRQVQPWNGKAASDTFDCPAYLMPPMEHLFDPLINSFLRLRPEEALTPNATEDEDAEMEEEVVGPVLMGSQRTRAVSQEEMDIFVDLFRKHSTKCLSSSNRYPSNAVAPSRPSQVSSVSIPKQQDTPRSKDTTLSQGTIPPVSSSIAANGRKRKKSLS